MPALVAGIHVLKQKQKDVDGRNKSGQDDKWRETGSLQRLTGQILGALDRDENRIAFLVRVALLLRLDETAPDLVIDRSGFVDLGPAVEPQDDAARQDARLAQRRIAHEDGDRRAVLEILGRASPPALPQRDVLVVEHHGAAARRDLGKAVRQHRSDETDVRRVGGIDGLVQSLRNLGQIALLGKRAPTLPHRLAGRKRHRWRRSMSPPESVRAALVAAPWVVEGAHEGRPYDGG